MCDAIRTLERLLKLGARVVVSVRRMLLHLPASFPSFRFPASRAGSRSLAGIERTRRIGKPHYPPSRWLRIRKNRAQEPAPHLPRGRLGSSLRNSTNC